VYSKQLSWMTHFPDVEGNRDGTFISFYMMVNAAANFLGPFVAGYVLTIRQNPDAAAGEECIISTTSYENSGCELTGIDEWMPSMVGTVSIALTLNVLYQSKIVNYGSTDRTRSTGDGPASAASRQTELSETAF
jgi:hypothetical protein